jgi:hypothetical protein
VKFVRAILCVAVLGGLLNVGFIHSAAAQTQPGAVNLRVTPAFDGYFKNGEWLVAWAEIENNGKNVDGQLSVQITNSSTQATYATSVSLPSGARKRVPLYILANNFSRELEVQLTGPDGLLAKQKITVRPQPNLNFLAGLIARERGGLALLNGVALPGQERPKVIVDVSLEDLPERMEGLRSFDLLVFNDVDTSRMTPGQAAALADWVQQGGRLVIGGGSTAALTLTGLPGALLPVSLGGQADLTAEELSGLADFAGGSAILTSGTFVSSKVYPAATSSRLAGDTGAPLVVESRYGEGRVDFISLNLSSAPFNSWPDTIKFWNKLLAPTGEYSQNLPADVSVRQLYGAEMINNLSNIPALDLPSIQWLSLLLGVYILLVGPVNYFILRRLRRMHLAWITIPALTLLFSAGAFGIGYLLHGTDVVLNQIALITPSENGPAEVNNYLGLFSPSQSAYSLEVKTPGLLSPIVSGDGNIWGPGGTISGGTNLTFLQGEQPQVKGLAIDQWSFQAFAEEERWSQFGSLKADLRLENDKVVGTLRNATSTPLKDIAVVIGSNFVRLGDLAAGAEKPVELDLTVQTNDQMNMPVSFRLYEAPVNSAGNTRLIDLKRSLVSRVVDGSGSKFSTMLSSKFPASFGASGNNGLTAILIAWVDQVPPDVTVSGTQIKKQVMGMITQEVALNFGEAPVVTIPTGLISGSMIEAPANGGLCSSNSQVGVAIQSGSAVFEFQLPALNGYRLSELRLAISRDGPVADAVGGISFYNWSEKSWTVLKSPKMGVNTIEQPMTFVDANHAVRVKIGAEANPQGFCTFLSLGLKAEKENASGGTHVSR